MLALSIAAIFQYVWSGTFLAELHADTTDTILWAAATRDSGAIANPTFHYGYFIPFGGNLCFLPFLRIFGLGTTSLRCGMTLFIVVFILAVLNLFRSFKWSPRASLFSSAVLLCGLLSTAKLREIHFGHVLYYSLGTLLLFLAVAAIGSKREKKAALLLVCGSLAWAAACGTPMLLYVTVPTLAALLLDLLFGKDLRPDWKGGFALVAAGVAGSLAGLALFLALSKNLSCPYADNYSLYAPARAWEPNWGKLLAGWVSLMCDLPNAHIPVTSPRGLVYAAQIGAALGLAAAPICALSRLHAFSRNERIFVFAHFALVGATLFFWVFGNISDANWRLCPLLVSSMAVTAILIRNWIASETPRFRRLGLLAAAGFAAASLASASLAIRTAPHVDDIWYAPDSLLTALEREGVEYGYCANFWLSNAITILSDERIPLRAVRFTKRGWAQRKLQTDDKWYDPRPERSRTAFICPPDLSHLVPTNRLINRLNCRQADLRNHTYVELDVFVYDGDFPDRIIH